MKTLLIIWTICFIIEAVEVFFGYKKLKNKFKEPRYGNIVKMFKQTKEHPSIRKGLKNYLNPYSYFIYGILLFVISPFLIPYSLIKLFKKVFNIKTKLDKEIDTDNKEHEKYKDYYEKKNKLAEEKFCTNESKDCNLYTDIFSDNIDEPIITPTDD